jgi:hypothetical protein
MKLQRSATSSKRLSSLSGVFLIPFSSGHITTTLGLVFHNICVRFVPSFCNASEVVLTYRTRVSPVAIGVTHVGAYVISTVYTYRLLLVALCVSHIKCLVMLLTAT